MVERSCRGCGGRRGKGMSVVSLRIPRIDLVGEKWLVQWVESELLVFFGIHHLAAIPRISRVVS